MNVAEVVETEADWKYVAAQGVDHIQGFYFGKPMPIDKLLEWVIERRSPVRQRASG